MADKIAVFIPIKDHSERIPNKNFTIIAGKPLHDILVDKFEKADFVSKIYINTDSQRILEYYKDNPKVLLIERKDEVIGDFVSMNDVIKSSFEEIKEEVILQTHVTNPLVSLETFRSAYLSYQDNLHLGYDSLFSVNKYFKRFFDKDFTPLNHDPLKLLRTQDLDPLYVENSCLYIFNKVAFAKTNGRIGKKPFLFEMSEYEAIDIDWPEDLEIVKKLLRDK